MGNDKRKEDIIECQFDIVSKGTYCGEIINKKSANIYRKLHAFFGDKLLQNLETRGFF